MARSDLDYYVLDAISYDAEQFDAIVAFLSATTSEWMGRFERVPQRPEVHAALMRLVKDQAVEIRVFDEAANDFVEAGPGVWPAVALSELYFDLTGRGRVLYLNFDF